MSSRASQQTTRAKGQRGLQQMHTGKRKWTTGKRFLRMEEDTGSFERVLMQ